MYLSRCMFEMFLVKHLVNLFFINKNLNVFQWKWISIWRKNLKKKATFINYSWVKGLIRSFIEFRVIRTNFQVSFSFPVYKNFKSNAAHFAIENEVVAFIQAGQHFIPGATERCCWEQAHGVPSEDHAGQNPQAVSEGACSMARECVPKGCGNIRP